MKNTILLAILAVALVLGITACGDVGGGSSSKVNNPQTVTYTGVSGGTTYTLKITEKTARYAASQGDSYELTAGSKTSAGEVSNVEEGGELTLKPSNSSTTFTAAVSESGITEMGGTITWSDNTTQPAPETITPSGSSGATTDNNGAIIGGVSGCTITAAVTGVSSNVTIDFINGWSEPLSNYISGASVKVSGGKAVIKLGVPTNDYLYNIISDRWFQDEIPSGITVSAPDAKISEYFDAGFFGSADDYNLFCEKDEEDSACLVYADKDVTIKGTYTDTYGGKTYTETYNVSLKAGWNYYLMQRNEATNTTTYTASTTLPAGFSWKVEQW
jgi:hypothetical protein